VLTYAGELPEVLKSALGTPAYTISPVTNRYMGF
jgi:hypothetical protein